MSNSYSGVNLVTRRFSAPVLLWFVFFFPHIASLGKISAETFGSLSCPVGFGKFPTTGGWLVQAQDSLSWVCRLETGPLSTSATNCYL